MADYREISQQYAQGGIKAFILLNAGASVAVLSQALDLIQKGLASEVRLAMTLWVLGIVAAALVWVAGFFSTRLVDKSEDEKRPEYLRLSNAFMAIGLGLMLLSLVLFALGCWTLAAGFDKLALPIGSAITTKPVV